MQAAVLHICACWPLKQFKNRNTHHEVAEGDDDDAGDVSYL